MILYEQFLSNSAKNASRPAFRYLGKETSYADLRLAIAKLSYLYQNELGPEARVALIARNSPAWIKTFFALTNIRAKIIPLDPESPPSEWAPVFKEAQPTHVAVTSDLVLKVRDFLNSERLLTPIVEIEKKQGGEYDPSFTAPPENKPLETDVILLLRTAGHGGPPKLVEADHKHLQGAASGLRSFYKPLPTDRVLTTLSWAHPFAFVHAMLFPILSGMTVVIDHGLQAVEFLDFIAESRVSRLVGTPPFYMKLIMTCRNEKRPLVGIKSATVGLGHVSHEMRRVFQVLKIAPLHVYGMAENIWTIAMEALPENLEEADLESDVHFKPVPGMNYKVMDDNGDVIEGSDARTGMLAVSGPAVMHAYFGEEREADTRNAIRGTWLYTGDFATLEGEPKGGQDELKIRFLGRKEDLIRIDGQWSALDPIEAVLRKLPGLQDAAAFACKTSKNQVLPACALVKIPGSSLSEKQALDFCAQHLTEDLQPKAAVFTDMIPKDAGGGVHYQKLRAQFSGILG